MLGSSQRGRLRRGASAALQVVAAITSIAVLAIGLVDSLAPDAGAPTLPEGRQIVAFRQLADRACEMGSQGMRRALAAARTSSERLGFLARATRRGVGELSSVTPPPSKAATFARDVWARRRIADGLLDLQRAVETGDRVRQARVEAELVAAEARSTELSRSLQLRRCAMVLPVEVHDLAN